MSDIRLFRLESGRASELGSESSDLEKPLQNLIERNLDELLGIRFLVSEYSTGKTHGGRIDTLGVDENSCPVIIEYKRSVGENVINQGLFYLDWLMDHQAEFKLLVMDALGKSAADSIDWSGPRLVCIAADFTKYDGHAVQQINRNIELIRYRRFGDDLLLFELVNSQGAAQPKNLRPRTSREPKQTVDFPLTVTATERLGGPDKPYSEILPSLSEPLAQLVSSIEDYILSIGDDVQRKELRLYVAFKRIKNFATLVLQKSKLLLYLHLSPAQIIPFLPTARDMTKIGHWGTGDIEIPIATQSDLDAVKPYIVAAYEGRALVR